MLKSTFLPGALADGISARLGVCVTMNIAAVLFLYGVSLIQQKDVEYIKSNIWRKGASGPPSEKTEASHCENMYKQHACKHLRCSPSVMKSGVHWTKSLLFTLQTTNLKLIYLLDT